MKQAIQRSGVLIGICLGCFFCNPKAVVIAKAPEVVYTLPADSTLVAMTTRYDSAFQTSVAREHTISNRMEEAYRAWRNAKRKLAIQERLDNLERTRRLEEKERKRQEKKKREREKKRKAAEKKKKRMQSIRNACGQVMGTNAQKILERIVEAEAGGEDRQGRILVANVVLNRVIDKGFPDTIAGVVFAHRGSRYQFSPISNGSYYRVTVSAGTKKAVKAALEGENPSKGALYFMERALAESGNVSWFDRCLTKVLQHGCHEFYK